ncbi:hypothetical protein TNCV_485901 [Trichonephila clavipes]|nr:hypothetical protein TNCV_485901 [Trichonephila clavipes]
MVKSRGRHLSWHHLSPNYFSTPTGGVGALDKFNIHRSHTRRVFSGTGLELLTRPATIRYLIHSATVATCLCSNCGVELSGYGHELVTGVSWARVLMPLKTRRVEEAIPPADVVVRKEGFEFRCPPRH